MKTYLILVREPDGRTVIPTDDETRQHQQDWQRWIGKLITDGHWVGGSSLTLSGSVIRPTADGLQTTDGPYQVNGLEIVGGYMLIKAVDLREAVALTQSCPVFDSDGFVEIREVA